MCFLLLNEGVARMRQGGRMFCRLVPSRSVCFPPGLAKLPSLRSSLRLFLEQLPWRVDDSEYSLTIVFCLCAELVHGSAVHKRSVPCIWWGGSTACSAAQHHEDVAVQQTGSRSLSLFCDNPDQHHDSACNRYKLKRQP